MTARNPTFVQVGVDATHIELIEGESSAGLMPLVDVAGRLKARGSISVIPATPGFGAGWNGSRLLNRRRVRGRHRG